MPGQNYMNHASRLCKNEQETMGTVGSREAKRNYFSYKNSKVSYLRFGEGKRLLIAFHGFGDTARLFLKLQAALEKDYTVCAVDLPFHGRTEWREMNFNKRDIKYIVDYISVKENKHQFDMMGYSFGARIVQCMTWFFSNRLERLFLIAPDGFATKWMFEISMVPRSIRYGLWWLLNKPIWFLKILDFFKEYHLIHPFIYDFTYKNLGKIDRRMRLFSYWLSMDDFTIPRKRIENKLKRLNIPIDLFLGKEDNIIPIEIGHQLIKNIPNMRLHELEGTHQLVSSKLSELLKKIIRLKNL